MVDPRPPLTPAEAAAAAMRAAVFGEELQTPAVAVLEEHSTEEQVDLSSEPNEALPKQNNTAPANHAAVNRDLSDFIELAGLNVYDPAAITRIYAGHPQRLLRRQIGRAHV